MRLLLALLLAAGFVQMAGAQDPPHFLPPSASAVRLTIELVPARVALNDEVTFKVSITNVSASPQYLSGDTLDTIQYAVRSVSGKSVRPYSDPPPPPRVPPVQYQELIWLRPGTSIVFYQHIPVSALGITKPGRYSVSGALSSYIFSKEQCWRSIKAFSSHSPRGSLSRSFVPKALCISVKRTAVPLRGPSAAYLGR